MNEAKEQVTITPREYQYKLAEHCINNDAIAVLPTGSGKTLIAILLIKALAKETKKKSAFIVTKGVNVQQQYEYIKKNMNLKIEKWQNKIMRNPQDFVKIIEENDVIILTADAFSKGITHGWIKMEDFAAIVIDECHHCMANKHPCRLIVETIKNYKRAKKQQHPRFLGLTASGLNGKVVLHQLPQKFMELEIALSAKVVTSNEYLQDEHRSTVKETVFFTDTYKEKMTFDGLAQLKIFCENNNEFSIGIESDPRKRIVECIKRATTVIDDCGLYCGYIVVEHDIIPNINNMINDGISSGNKFLLLSSALSVFQDIYDRMKITVGNCDTYEQIKDHLHPRVIKIIEVLEAYENFRIKNGNRCEAIIFAEKCDTVMALALLLQKLAKLRHNFIKAAYAVGTGTQKLKFDKNTSESDYGNLSETIDRFRRGEINCLVATQILEEGIDIPSCNLVICTNIAFTFSSYIQSRGRARDSSSLLAYIVAHEDRSKFIYNAHIFKSIEKFLLKQIASFKKNISDNKNVFYDVHLDTLEDPYTVDSTGASVKLTTAVSLVNLYCSQLPSDVYTVLSPKSRCFDIPGGFGCEMELPSNSSVREKIIGRGYSWKHAYMSAALKTCKILHENKELDDNLLPYSKEKFAEKENFTFFDDTGTTKKHRLYDKKIADILVDNFISAKKPFYVYIIEMNLLKTVSAELNPKKRKIMDFKNDTPHVFGFCTIKLLPEIPTFPLFEKYGKLIASVKLASKQFNVTSTELKKLQLFHEYIFGKILKLSGQKIFEPNRALSATLIIPLKRFQDGFEYEIDFEIAEKAITGFPSQPTKDERAKFIYDPKKYQDAIIKPWYHPAEHESRTYYVEEITEKNLNSAFDTVDFPTFKAYYKEQYNLEAYNHEQNMLSASVVPKEMNCFFPPYISKSNKTNREKEHLVPEFVLLHPLPASYWLMLIKIPSVLYRINHLLLADEFRHKTSNVKCIPSFEMDGLEYSSDYYVTIEKMGKFQATESFDESIEEDETDNESTSDSNDEFSKWNDSGILADLMDDSDIDSYCSLKKFEREDSLTCIETFENGNSQILPNDYFNNKDINERLSAEEVPPVFKIRRQEAQNSSFGVQPVLLLQALTTTGACDGFNLERLETMGDSFLKLVTTIYLYQHYPNLHEGRLTLLRSGQICNANLLNLGWQKRIPSLMVSCKFDPKVNWIPPCYSMQNEFNDDSIEDDNVLPNEINVNEEYNHFLKQRMSDKSVADCVEALIGAHFTYLGPDSGMEFMKWLGLKVEDSTPMKSPIYCVMERFDSYKAQELVMSQYSQKEFNELEKTIGYTFRDKSFLIQAFIHLSCHSPLGCYQRLEFLGDAVLDFLITEHLYYRNSESTPGELTNLRSALVNNVNFASLVIKHEIHNYIILENEKLSSSIRKFSYLCKQKGGDLNFHDMMELVVENDADGISVEEVEVPKALGDIFESLAGAVYLDSGMKVEVVWQVFYNLMKEVITKWCQNPPKQPVSELFEKYGNKIGPFEKGPKVNGKASMMIKVNGETILSGVGKSLSLAKRSAAIEALKYFEAEEKKKSLNKN